MITLRRRSLYDGGGEDEDEDDDAEGNVVDNTPQISSFDGDCDVVALLFSVLLLLLLLLTGCVNITISFITDN